MQWLHELRTLQIYIIVRRSCQCHSSGAAERCKLLAPFFIQGRSCHSCLCVVFMEVEALLRVDKDICTLLDETFED